MDAIGELTKGQKVLLLAHTNAAKEEFTRRTRAAGGRIEVSTIDSFCNRVLGPYAPAVDLPSPLDRNIGNRGERVPFSDLALRTVELFARTPTLARLLGKKYPLIIGDEHQDAVVNQHLVLVRMADAGGGRLRLFGDPMQAIFDVDGAVSWDGLKAEVDECALLNSPKRWRLTEQSKELGEWIVMAREELNADRPLLLAAAPEAVSVVRCNRTSGSEFHQGNAGLIGEVIRKFVQDSGDDSLCALAFPTHTALTIESAAHFLGLRVNEGSDYDGAYKLLEQAIEAGDNPARLASLLLDFIKDSSVGISQADHDRLSRTFEPNQIVKSPRGRLEPLAAVFEPIYHEPSLVGLFDACRRVRRLAVPRFRLRKRLCLRLLASMSKKDADAAQDELSAVIAARKAVSAKPTRAASTIHKAKGMEFGRVLVMFCGSSHFPDTEAKRRLLYVAISRAVNGITLHVPMDSPSPLIEMN